MFTFCHFFETFLVTKSRFTVPEATSFLIQNLNSGFLYFAYDVSHEFVGRGAAIGPQIHLEQVASVASGG